MQADVLSVTNWPDENLREACKRIPARKVWSLIPPRFYERSLEQNQQVASCCRHPENHEISAWYSSAEDEAKGIPDIYVFHCECGRAHRTFCVGGSNRETGEGLRPFWKVG
jgi:hypothetical protein